uniref:winged helix-turn-helix domain-containing protein n=1 Tax=Cellulomonas hominis TaxID=156981 RepID=UPI0018AB9456|nr:winged helix-turn-helix domain-containing protein [Cellulomonas hominis]
MSVLTPATSTRPTAHPARRPAEPAADLPSQADLRRFEELLAALPLTPAVLVDLPGRRLAVDGQDVDLTRQEFDLVAYLARSAGRVVTRDELYDGAWRSQDLSDRTRTVDVHVRRVRAKSGLDGLIATVRGVGYRLNVLDGLRIEG